MDGHRKKPSCETCCKDDTDGNDSAIAHVICKKCVETLIVQDTQGVVMLHCPMCKGNKPIFHCAKCSASKSVCYCHECKQFLCKSCMTNQDECKTHKRSMLSFDQTSREKVIYELMGACNVSATNQFCKTCDHVGEDQDSTAVKAHYYHQYDVVSECLLKQRDVIVKYLQPMFVSGEITEVMSKLDHLMSQDEQTRDKIHRIQYLLEGKSKTKAPKRIAYANTNVPGKEGSENMQSGVKFLTGNIETIKESTLKKNITFEIKHVETIDNLGYPHHLTVTENGTLIVAENESNCVTIFRNRRKFRSIGWRGPPERSLNSPCGAAVLNGDTVIVADEHCIKKFTMEGVFIASVGNPFSKGIGMLNFKTPWAVAVDDKGGKIYVADTGNHRIQVFNFNLSYQYSFGNYGTKQGQFNWPSHIALNSHQEVIVADCYNHRIQVFSSEGDFLREIKQYRYTGLVAELQYPISVCVDQRDVLFVLEHDRNRICLFDSAGNFMKYFMLADSKHVKQRCYGLAVDRNGFLYVSDSNGKQVQIFTQFF